jgi:hypothetical protein
MGLVPEKTSGWSLITYLSYPPGNSVNDLPVLTPLHRGLNLNMLFELSISDISARKKSSK